MLVDDSRALLTNVDSGTQLAIPGALVLLPTSDSGTPVADRPAWQRAVLRSCLPRAAKLVALALASHAVDVTATCEPVHPLLPGPAAVCSPGLVTLSAETGYSRTHVQRQIRLLRDLGWLIGLARPAARRPASFALSMSDSVRTTASAAPAPVMPTAAAAPAADGSARRAPAPVGAGIPDSSGPSPRQAGARPTSDRPSAAARRRSRVTGTAMAKALKVIGNLSAVTSGPESAQEGSGSPIAAAAPVAPSPTVGVPAAGVPTAGGGEPDLPVVAERTVADAAGQVVATLACAMRRDPESLTVAGDQLTRILTVGLWSAAELAMHLVDTIGPSLGVGRVDDPVDHLLRRLDHLPASASECLCRSCRSWVTVPAAAAQGAPSAVAAERTAPVSLPGLAAIEQAAAAGAAQSRVHPERTSGAA